MENEPMFLLTEGEIDARFEKWKRKAWPDVGFYPGNVLPLPKVSGTEYLLQGQLKKIAEELKKHIRRSDDGGWCVCIPLESGVWKKLIEEASDGE